MPLYPENFIPKYENGVWKWDSNSNKFIFNKIADNKKDNSSQITPNVQLYFPDNIVKTEEQFFLEQFSRQPKDLDYDVVTLQDIKNIILFEARDQFSKMFKKFTETPTFDLMLNNLIIYFEYFLKVIQFLKIRRQNLENHEKPTIRNVNSIQVEKMISKYLCQYRILLAREYCNVLIGDNNIKISSSERDRKFFETFLSFCVQAVWIAHRRNSYDIIDYEVNRLFRSQHFNVTRRKSIGSFSKIDQRVLYGDTLNSINYRYQKSPLCMEILNISPENSDILWIGIQKYNGCDPRMIELELEFATPPSQICFAGIHHGILGQPKRLYDIMLNLNWDVVRIQKYTLNYDPYRLIKPPTLKIPHWDNYNHKYEKIKAKYKFGKC